MTKATDCPCTSGLPYRSCCAPYHRGEREADSAEILMRSRFSAFAKKEVDYLARTLHPEHEDRALPHEELLRSLRTSATAFKYMGLRILDRSGPDEEGIARVLFVAHLFEKGRDRSFVELSSFAHDGVGWRYLRGSLLPLDEAGDLDTLTITSFARLAPAAASR
jgi:SEC-C motif-containing protein